VQFKWGFLLRFGPIDQIVFSDCPKRLYDNSVTVLQVQALERQIVPDSRSSCTEGSVTEVSARPTYKKRSSVSRVQSSWASVGDETAVVNQVAGSGPGQRLVDQGGDLEASAAGGELKRRGCYVSASGLVFGSH